MKNRKTTKNIGTELLVKLIGALAIAGMCYFVLYPTATRAIYSTGAGAIFKQTPECKIWSDRYVEAMQKKASTTADSIIEEAKLAGCKK
ncbi:hypothetical protein [Burkholderia multivorans]|uniref:hypothetical protein n=1 Tax=Burkholderia multivorans TaxID=87883 RepID=UPI0011B286D5|nr:hypothetical protein [Burkholderia multivorans]